MKRNLIIAAAVLAAVIAAFFFLRDGKSEASYRLEKAVKGDINASVTANGTVNAVKSVLVGTQVSGTIKEIFVDFNSTVKKGQLIAEIDPALFKAQVDQALANHLAAKANLDKANASLEEARRTAERYRELTRRDLVARSELDTAETNYASAKAQTGAARAQVKQTEAALTVAETNLKYTRIVSPVDGIVVSRNIDVGQTVAASFQTPTLFTIAEDLTKMQVDTNVAEADIGKLKAGLPVEFTVDAYPDAIFKGAVFAVRNAPIVVQNVVTYDVVINVDNPEFKLKPGMTANVSVIYSEKKSVLKVPNAALRFRPSDAAGNAKNGGGWGGSARPRAGAGGRETEGPGVWVVSEGKPLRIGVAAGISDGFFTEITSGGLKPGDEVITDYADEPKGRGSFVPRIF